MAKASEAVAHKELVDGSQTALHLHAGGSGGLIDKSGVETTDANGEATVTFNTNYSNTNYVIQLTAAETSDSITAAMKTGTKTVSGFTICTFEDKGQSIGNVSVFWSTGPYSNP